MSRTLERPAVAAAREKRRVLFLCAAIIPVFTFADSLALGRFSVQLFSLRLLWAAITLAIGWAVPRVPEATERALMIVLGVVTSFFFCLLVELTGAERSPLFGWILAMPVLVAVVVQEHPMATIASGVAMVAGGIFIQARARVGGAVIAEWTVQAAAMSALAAYASVAYRRLRARERLLHHAQLEALEQERQRVLSDQARERAETALKIRDEFLSTASHELRTPLTSLMLSLSGMDASQPRVQTAARQVRRLEQLVKALLDVSRIVDGRLGLERAEADLVAIAREVVERHREDAARSGTTLTLEASEPVTGVWDESRIDQVITNLVANALHYGRAKPVTVRVRGEGEEAVLEVEDRGIGIAPEDQKRIFGRFERAVSGRHYGGLGLGLWITERIVAAHGGTISVQSQLGQGATFTVRLPRKI